MILTPCLFIRRNIRTQEIPPLFLSVKFISFFLMTPIDSTNNQNTMRRVI